MKEYIWREAVLRIIDKYGCGNGSVLGYHSGAVDCAGSEIARIPAADVVEAVRCKDCRHMTLEMGYVRFCNVWERPNGMGDDGFCNYGELKEDA